MTKFRLFQYGLITYIQDTVIGGETEKDLVRELFDVPAVIYSDKIAKAVVGGLDKQYIVDKDKQEIMEYAFGDRHHVVPKYTYKDYSIAFLPTEPEDVGFTLIIPKGEPLVKTFNRHRKEFLYNSGILGRNSLMYYTPHGELSGNTSL